MLFPFIAAFAMFPFSLFSSTTDHVEVPVDRYLRYYQTRKIYSFLVDVRAKREFEKGHLPGAVNIPFNSNDFKHSVEEALPHQPKDVWVLFVYAADENQTQEYKAELKKIYNSHKMFSGPTALYYVQGGYEAWAKLNHEMKD
ncbi:MAG: rhodanese-like domain-containing protein [Leptospiraceae bacterium]|nr:rhodanese-like domain-containing protein [Leptospiraceae bacterium]